MATSSPKSGHGITTNSISDPGLNFNQFLDDDGHWKWTNRDGTVALDWAPDGAITLTDGRSGVPYVETLLTPVTLTTAPFYDPASAGPGLVVLPAPGPGLVVMPLWVERMTSDGISWNQDIQDVNLHVAYGDAAGEEVLGVQDTIATNGWALDDNPIVRRQDITFWSYNDASLFDNSSIPNIEDLPLVMWITDPLSAGERSVVLRWHYTIVPVNPGFPPDIFFTVYAVDQTGGAGSNAFAVVGNRLSAVGPTFDIVGSTGNDGTYTTVSTVFTSQYGNGVQGTITAVNQGTKTFTLGSQDVVAGFPTDSVIDVVASTGNDGFYTVVSATLVVADTLVVVAEAVPSAVADGVLNGPYATKVITVEAIPDSTVDGIMVVE